MKVIEEAINEHNDRSVKLPNLKKRIKGLKNSKPKSQGPVAKYQKVNICITGVPEGEEKEKDQKIF